MFYWSADGWLTAVPVKIASDGQRLEFGSPSKLFQRDPIRGWFSYYVSPDGQQFLMQPGNREDPTAPITVILNWKGKDASQ